MHHDDWYDSTVVGFGNWAFITAIVLTCLAGLVMVAGIVYTHYVPTAANPSSRIPTMVELEGKSGVVR